MLANLKLGRKYDGLIYLAESIRNFQRIESHHHPELELNLVVEGAITYVMNGRRFTFSPRTLLWLFPRQEHQLVDRSDNLRLYVVAFKPSLIDQSCHASPYDGLKRKDNEQESILSTVLDPKTFDFVTRIMDSLMQGALDSDILNKEAGFGPASDFRFQHHDADALNAGLRYLLLLCWRIQRASKAGRDAVSLHPAVRRALKILSEQNSRQDLRQLARACGTSDSYLSRTFHRQVGVPLSRYRNSLRLSRFFELYGDDNRKSLAETVYSAGFGSYAQFYKVFFQAYGHGPREILELHGGNAASGAR
jgi:methylphosphotriester-DNA--protein-cysteine methyltransferase